MLIHPDIPSFKRMDPYQVIFQRKTKQNLTSYLTFRFGFKSDFLVYTYLVIKKLRSLLKPEL